jgi:hypothetical protein
MADLAAALEKLTAVASPAMSYNTDLIRQAWNTVTRKRRNDAIASSSSPEPIPYSYVDQLWSDHIIVRLDDDSSISGYLRVPFTVNAPGVGIEDVVFGTPEKVREVFVAASARSREQSLNRVLLAASD